MTSDVNSERSGSTRHDNARLWRKIALRLFPLVGLAYLVGYIDRANLGYVATPMAKDIGLDPGQIGLAGGLFFVGYVLVEVPSNLALHRFGARRWITRILVTWGLVTALTAAVNSAGWLYAARILLGLAEAGLAAGIYLHLTYWFPRRQRAWVYPVFVLMIPFSSVIGAPIAAGILAWGQSLLGLAGWRSLFLIEGILTVLIGVLIFAMLPDRPRDARWLSQDEKVQAEEALASDTVEQVQRGSLSGMREALVSGKVWALAISFFAVVFGLYPLAFFLPSMIATLRGGNNSYIAGVLISAIPYVIAMICIALWTRYTQRRSSVMAVAVPMGLGAVGLLWSAFAGSGIAFVIAVCLSVAGIYTSMAQFWRIPTAVLTGAAAAAGIALINSVSNISGFVGPWVTGALKTSSGSYTSSLVLISIVTFLGLILLVATGRRLRPGAAHFNDEQLAGVGQPADARHDRKSST